MQTQHIISRRSVLSLCAGYSIALMGLLSPTWVSAQESGSDNKTTPTQQMDHSKMGGKHNDIKTTPTQQMDHSKMGDMHMDGMSMTGNTDYDFAVNMRKHHQMGIDMMQPEIKNGKDPKMVQMAKDMVATQKKEIAVLDQWIAANKKPK